MENTHKRLEALLQAMPPISLAEMSEIRLMKRTDQKYLTNIDTLAELLRLTRDDYYTQEIDGRRISPYATTYWDDENEAFFHFHQAGHRPRRKVRVRTYVGSGQSFLEVKRKDNHGKTFKSRVTVPSLEAVMNDRAGQDFLQEKTGFDFSQLRPTVANRFYRITLVNRGKTERLTIDFDIRFRNLKTGREAAMDHIVVIELKRDGRVHSPIIPLLRQLRIKPAGFSKYCIGACVTDDTLRVNRFKKRLIRIRKVANKPVPSAAG